MFLIVSSILTGAPLIDRGLRLRDQAAVENLFEVMVLPLAVIDADTRRHFGLGEQQREIEALGLPVLDQRALVEHLHLTDHLVHRAIAELGHDLAHLLGDEEEIVDDVLGLADEALAQHRVLRGDADRAGVEVAHAHHHAAGRDQRRGREAELVGAEHRADHDVAPGAQAAVDLHGDAAAQAVEHQRLVGFGKADLPWRAGVLERGEGRAPGAALEARDRSRGRRAPWRRRPRPCRRRPSETSFTDTSADGLVFFRS
jgi:hypothetical protein